MGSVPFEAHSFFILCVWGSGDIRLSGLGLHLMESGGESWR